MAFTANGRRKRDALARLASGEGIIDAIKNEMEKLPSMIVNRVRESGSGASGKGGSLKRFSTPYSTKWGKKRRDAGLQTGSKDFWFSGDMWNDFKLKETSVRMPTMTFTYGVSEGKQAEKVSGHNERERKKSGVSNILHPTKEDIDELRENTQMAINRYLRDALR